MTEEQVRREGERCIECSCTDKHDCKLRAHGCAYHCDASAIRGGKNPRRIDDRHPEILQDTGKCVKCGVCVKICKEVVGQSLLGQQKRGFSTYIGTAFNAGFPASCAECGKCIEACPTGALAWRTKK